MFELSIELVSRDQIFDLQIELLCRDRIFDTIQNHCIKLQEEPLRKRLVILGLREEGY